jgi:hypothetical protein
LLQYTDFLTPLLSQFGTFILLKEEQEEEENTVLNAMNEKEIVMLANDKQIE